MNAGDMEKLAKMAAKEAVSETFLSLGWTFRTQLPFEASSPSCETFTMPRVTPATSSLPVFSARSLAAACMRSGLASRPVQHRLPRPCPLRPGDFGGANSRQDTSPPCLNPAAAFSCHVALALYFAGFLSPF